jgi:hypothetical protein
MHQIDISPKPKIITKTMEASAQASKAHIDNEMQTENNTPD